MELMPIDISDDYYARLCTYVFEHAGEEEFQRVLNSDPYCELAYIQDDPKNSFLGFLGNYDFIRSVLSRHSTVLDLGCGMAPQSYLFELCDKYIGVDNYYTVYQRFCAKNSEHYHMSIQDFCKFDLVDPNEVIVICSYVPDAEARELALSFPNHYVYYPKIVSDYQIENKSLIRGHTFEIPILLKEELQELLEESI